MGISDYFKPLVLLSITDDVNKQNKINLRQLVPKIKLSHLCLYPISDINKPNDHFNPPTLISHLIDSYYSSNPSFVKNPPKAVINAPWFDQYAQTLLHDLKIRENDLINTPFGLICVSLKSENLSQLRSKWENFLIKKYPKFDPEYFTFAIIFLEDALKVLNAELTSSRIELFLVEKEKSPVTLKRFTRIVLTKIDKYITKLTTKVDQSYNSVSSLVKSFFVRPQLSRLPKENGNKLPEEANLKMLADLLFLRKDFSEAQKQYKNYLDLALSSQDASSDKFLISRCCEMLALSFLFESDQSNNWLLYLQCAKNNYFSQGLYDHCMRTCIWMINIIKKHPTFILKLDKMLNFDSQTPSLNSALVLEQKAMLFSQCKLRDKEFMRKHALNLCLSAYVFGKINFREHSLVLFKMAFQCYKGKEWPDIDNFLCGNLCKLSSEKSKLNVLNQLIAVWNHRNGQAVKVFAEIRKLVGTLTLKELKGAYKLKLVHVSAFFERLDSSSAQSYVASLRFKSFCPVKIELSSVEVVFECGSGVLYSEKIKTIALFPFSFRTIKIPIGFAEQLENAKTLKIVKVGYSLFNKLRTFAMISFSDYFHEKIKLKAFSEKMSADLIQKVGVVSGEIRLIKRHLRLKLAVGSECFSGEILTLQVVLVNDSGQTVEVADLKLSCVKLLGDIKFVDGKAFEFHKNLRTSPIAQKQFLINPAEKKVLNFLVRPGKKCFPALKGTVFVECKVRDSSGVRQREEAVRPFLVHIKNPFAIKCFKRGNVFVLEVDSLYLPTKGFDFFGVYCSQENVRLRPLKPLHRGADKLKEGGRLFFYFVLDFAPGFSQVSRALKGKFCWIWKSDELQRKGLESFAIANLNQPPFDLKEIDLDGEKVCFKMRLIFENVENADFRADPVVYVKILIEFDSVVVKNQCRIEVVLTRKARCMHFLKGEKSVVLTGKERREKVMLSFGVTAKGVFDLGEILEFVLSDGGDDEVAVSQLFDGEHLVFVE